MSIISLKKEEIPSEFDRLTASKYPWRTTPVGEGFFVPRTSLSREDYRPSCPPDLKAKGYKFISRKWTFKGTEAIMVVRKPDIDVG